MQHNLVQEEQEEMVIRSKKWNVKKVRIGNFSVINCFICDVVLSNFVEQMNSPTHESIAFFYKQSICLQPK